MKKTLSRDLGIVALISIACGAMVSGLLVLPGYAAGMTGPSVFLAFLLAGLLFLPATFSKCEMATALPQSGGDYLFIDRSMGPIFSTISGLGMFFTLTMKSAFALSGFGAYLLVIMPFPEAYAEVVGIGIAGLIILINYRGAKKSGKLQQVLFAMTVLALMWFIGEGSLGVHDENLQPPMTGGWTGFFSATAFVFVSYAGVTKIASVAEEVKNPGRMIPIGMLVSLGIMVFLYVIVVYVMVGNVHWEQFLELKKFKDAPLALAGREIAGNLGMYFLASVSALALIAMANAGVLASSRYPFALSRYKQLPDFINRIHPEFSTPSVSILLTGMILILSIAFLPVVQLAKLASAFKLIILGMLNCALIILRESNIEWYQPEFESPFYPYVQIFGILASIFLICFLGWMSIFSSILLIIGASTWYLVYVRHRVDRKGAIFQSAKVDAEDLKLFERARSPGEESKESVIVPLFNLENVEATHIERRLRLAASLCAEEERLDVVDFVEIAEQSLLSEHELEESHLKLLEERVRFIRNEIDNEIHIDQVITHNSRGALHNYAIEENPHWVVFDWKEPSPWQYLIGIREWWLEDFPCDLLFFQDNDRSDFKDILVITEPGPYDGEVVYAANHIAEFVEGNITFLNPTSPDNPDVDDFVKSYQDELLKMCETPATTETIHAENWIENVLEQTNEYDLLVIGGLTGENFPGFEGKKTDRKVSREADCSVARVRSNLQSPKSVLSAEEKQDFNLHEYLDSESIQYGIRAVDKNELFRTIASRFSESTSVDDRVIEALWEREEIQNTYIEDGIAFPHGISDKFEDTTVNIFVLDQPINYTPNGDTADVFVATLGPPGERQIHLRLIGQLSSMFVKSDLKEILLENQDPEEVLEELSDLQDNN